MSELLNEKKYEWKIYFHTIGVTNEVEIKKSFITAMAFVTYLLFIAGLIEGTSLNNYQLRFFSFLIF